MGDDATLLALLLDERAIVRTLHQYGHAMDYGLEQQFVDVFTEDGIFDVRLPDGRIGHREEGRAELAAYIAKYPKPPTVYNKHIMVDPLIEINGDQATVESYWIALRGDANRKPTMACFGRYKDDVRKIDGKWLIKERFTQIEAI